MFVVKNENAFINLCQQIQFVVQARLIFYSVSKISAKQTSTAKAHGLFTLLGARFKLTNLSL